MVVSVHIAEVGVRRALRLLYRPPKGVPGLRYAEAGLTLPLGTAVPKPSPGRVGLIASWDDDAAIERFLASDPAAEALAGGWHARLEPVRVAGAWPELPELPANELPMDPDEPVAVLTLGRLRLTQARRFVRASAPAETHAVSHPAMVSSTALARPPRFVSTFSLWRSTAEMREYAVGQADTRHLDAMKAHSAKPFHHHSAFVRFRPYATSAPAF